MDHAIKVSQWVAKHKNKIEMFFLPPYAPEHNPDEYLNNDLKQQLKKFATVEYPGGTGQRHLIGAPFRCSAGQTGLGLLSSQGCSLRRVMSNICGRLVTSRT